MQLKDQIISSGRTPKLLVSQVGDARATPKVRGDLLLRPLESIWLRLSGIVSRAFPAEYNPFSQLGAVANTMFIVALVTGILLLFWYSPSVNSAYDSVEAMKSSPYLAELMRSLHRYSSDVCMLFIILHAFQMLGARKFGGARWVAWISGMLLLGLVWMDGWTGYWLVWDERAQQIALGSAAFLDMLPIFPDPLIRSFLTNDGLNSLFFFIIFFIHMLIPIGMAAFLWMHIMRTNAAKFFTSIKMSAALTIVLVLVSLLFPATLAGKADMMTVPQDLTIDWLFMMPMWFTERLSGSMLWLMLFIATMSLWGIPWWLTKRKPDPAVVNPASCNGCTQCVTDCPFNAIDMILPETGGKPHRHEVALVNPDKCIGCGVCVGSCDSSSISQASLPVLDVRRFVSSLEVDSRHVAFVCAGSAGEKFNVDENGTSDALPGYRVVPVPCVGWVHMLTVERALRRGAEGVLIAGCSVDPACRTGADFTGERLEGDREPWLRTDHVDRSKVSFVRFDRTNPKGLVEAAAAFKEGRDVKKDRSYSSRIRKMSVAILVILGLTASTVWLSDGPYSTVKREHAAFIVSIKHAGNVETGAGNDGEVDDSNVLPHMRRARPIERIRVPVRLRISVQDSTVLETTLEPGGLFNDGLSIGIAETNVTAGVHSVRVELNNSSDSTWTHVWSEVLTFKPLQRKVLTFDEDGRFMLYQQGE